MWLRVNKIITGGYRGHVILHDHIAKSTRFVQLFLQLWLDIYSHHEKGLLNWNPLYQSNLKAIYCNVVLLDRFISKWFSLTMKPPRLRLGDPLWGEFRCSSPKGPVIRTACTYHYPAMSYVGRRVVVPGMIKYSKAIPGGGYINFYTPRVITDNIPFNKYRSETCLNDLAIFDILFLLIQTDMQQFF